jgi:Outer membrane protein beta-barrel domain
MNFQSIARVSLAVLICAGFASTASADAGIKFGPTFADFNSDALDFKNRTGIHAGVFFGGNRSGVFGLQGELNWIRKRAETDPAQQGIRIDYLQIPALLRLNIGTDSASGFAVYGIAGPAFDIKIADEIEGVTIDNGWEGADVDLILGGGIEVARIIVEGRFEKGFRRINNNFLGVTEIKKQAFTILFGIRFD